MLNFFYHDSAFRSSDDNEIQKHDKEFDYNNLYTCIYKLSKRIKKLIKINF